MFTNNNQSGGMPNVPSLSRNVPSFGASNQTQQQSSVFGQQGQNQNNQTNAGQAASSAFPAGNNQAFNFGAQKNNGSIFGGNNNSANQTNATNAAQGNTTNATQGGFINQGSNQGNAIFSQKSNTTQGTGTSPFGVSNNGTTQPQGGNVFTQGQGQQANTGNSPFGQNKSPSPFGINNNANQNTQNSTGIFSQQTQQNKNVPDQQNQQSQQSQPQTQNAFNQGQNQGQSAGTSIFAQNKPGQTSSNQTSAFQIGANKAQTTNTTNQQTSSANPSFTINTQNASSQEKNTNPLSGGNEQKTNTGSFLFNNSNSNQQTAGNQGVQKSDQPSTGASSPFGGLLGTQNKSAGIGTGTATSNNKEPQKSQSNNFQIGSGNNQKKPQGQTIFSSFKPSENKPVSQQKPGGQQSQTTTSPQTGGSMFQSFGNKDQQKKDPTVPSQLNMNTSMGNNPVTVNTQNTIELQWQRSSKSCEQKVDEWRRILDQNLKELKDMASSLVKMQESREQNHKIRNNFKVLSPVIKRLSQKNQVNGYLDNIERRQQRLMQIITSINRDISSDAKPYIHANAEKIGVYQQMQKQYEELRKDISLPSEDDSSSNQQLSNIYNNLSSFEHELSRQNNILSHYFSKFFN